MHLDASFLIDLQRERRRRSPGPAGAFLARHPGTRFSISVVALMEYAEGFPDDELWKLEKFLRLFAWVPVDHHVALHASRIRRRLRQAGSLLPDNDILIAAGALSQDAPLVTDNTDHFARIDGLEVLAYR